MLTSVVQGTILRPYVKLRFNIKVTGASNVDEFRGQPAIFVANHTSDLDAAIIFSYLPSRIASRLATGAAADRFFTSRLHSFVPRVLFNAYPVDRPGKAGERAHAGISSDLLSARTSLLIFPEGTRRGVPGVLGRFSVGPARLAQRHEVPVVPIALHGVSRAWPVGSIRPARGRHEIHVRFGKPIYPRSGEPALVMTHRIRESILKECGLISSMLGANDSESID